MVVNVYNDRSFDFVTKSPPAAALLKQAAGIAKGSGVPNKEKVGTVTTAQIENIVKTENGRPQRPRRRARQADDRGDGPQHGTERGRVMQE